MYFSSNIKDLRGFFITALVSLLLCAASSCYGQNLIGNGGFESGVNPGWNHLANSGADAEFTEETVDVQEGTKALKVVISTLGTNSWDVQSLGPTANLTTGTDYTLTYWARSAVNGVEVRMVMQNTLYRANTQYLTTAWTKYTWQFTAAESSPQFKIHYPQLGAVWIDDIQLVETNPASSPGDVMLSPETRYQTMVGFGGAVAWYAPRIYSGSDANDAALEQLMFDDLGIDVLRLKNWYYPVNYPASKDPSNVTGQSSFNTMNALYDAAKRINPEIQVLLSSWSPPASLKSNNDRNNGGTLKKDADGFMYDELAQYWVDCLDNLGWTPDYLSFQNEPGWLAAWETCILSPTETASNAGYAEAADAIWEAIKQRPNAPRMVGAESENLNNFNALNTPLLSRSYFDVHGYHTYDIGNESAIDSASTISKLNMVRDSFGDRPNWMTEWSKDTLDWLQLARVVHNTVVEANASAYIMWPLVWDGGNANTLIAIDGTGAYEIRDKCYVLKHYAKHVDKGYKRFEVTMDHTDVRVSGFLSTDASSITLVAINNATTPEPITLVHDALSISAIAGYQSVAGNFYQTLSGLDATSPINLPAQSLTTFVLTLSTPLSPVNSAPTFASSPITETAATEGVAYDSTLKDDASDVDHEALTFAKMSGPAWLNVAANGTLSGTPGSSDAGSNSFTVSVSDGMATAVQATLKISVAGLFSSYVSMGAFGLDPADQGFEDDPDGDGLANGLEFLFGTDPSSPSPGISNVSVVNGSTITFTHPSNSNPAADVSIIYQWSPNLTDWYAGDGVDGPAGGPTVVTIPTTSDAVTTVTATANQAFERIFIRIGGVQE